MSRWCCGAGSDTPYTLDQLTEPAGTVAGRRRPGIEHEGVEVFDARHKGSIAQIGSFPFPDDLFISSFGRRAVISRSEAVPFFRDREND